MLITQSQLDKFGKINPLYEDLCWKLISENDLTSDNVDSVLEIYSMATPLAVKMNPSFLPDILPWLQTLSVRAIQLPDMVDDAYNFLNAMQQKSVYYASYDSDGRGKMELAVNLAYELGSREAVEDIMFITKTYSSLEVKRWYNELNKFSSYLPEILDVSAQLIASRDGRGKKNDLKKIMDFTKTAYDLAGVRAVDTLFTGLPFEDGEEITYAAETMLSQLRKTGSLIELERIAGHFRGDIYNYLVNHGQNIEASLITQRLLKQPVHVGKLPCESQPHEL